MRAGLCTCSASRRCKRCYDQQRRSKIRAGDWTYNPKPPAVLTEEQQQVLTGSMLGDGYLFKFARSANAGLAIGRASKDLAYLQYEQTVFRGFCSSPIATRTYRDTRTGNVYTNVKFRTCASPIFTAWHRDWYVAGRKCLPKHLELTPLSCAIWFADDGSITFASGGCLMSLYTDGFTHEETARLVALLTTQLGPGFTVRRKGDHRFIGIAGSARRAFCRYIDAVFPVSMSRKSERWRNARALL